MWSLRACSTPWVGVITTPLSVSQSLPVKVSPRLVARGLPVEVSPRLVSGGVPVLLSSLFRRLGVGVGVVLVGRGFGF